MSENIDITEKDLAEVEEWANAPAENASYHSILEVWREVLSPAAAEATKKVTPQWANRLVHAYPEVQYSDMNALRDRYFGKIAELLDILVEEIAGDDECLNVFTPEEDVERNSHHYKNLLLVWQQTFLQWEMDWTCDDPWAPVELAAIGEVHKMFFGPTGLTSFLDNIKFEYSEDDQAMLAAALEEQRETELARQAEEG